MKTLSTVNVIVMSHGIIDAVYSYSDNELGNYDAEEHFIRIIASISPAPLSEDDKKLYLNYRNFDEWGKQISLVHSQSDQYKEEFIPSTLTMEDIEIGVKYNCHPKDGDFENEFVGTVISMEKGFIQVRDQEDNVFDCDPNQLTPNTDEIMHGE